MRFEITFDYLCPFARNVNEAIVAGVRAGEPWEPTFRAFSLSQVHLEPDDPPVWAASFDQASGVLALTWGLAVRDAFPDRFLDAHLALFGARHDQGLDISDPDVVRQAMAGAGLDPDDVAATVATGVPLTALESDHTGAVADFSVFGVPTLLLGGEGVYLRMMQRGDVEGFRRVLDMAAWTDLNEFKRTTISR